MSPTAAKNLLAWNGPDLIPQKIINIRYNINTKWSYLVPIVPAKFLPSFNIGAGEEGNPWKPVVERFKGTTSKTFIQKPT